MNVREYLCKQLITSLLSSLSKTKGTEVVYCAASFRLSRRTSFTLKKIVLQFNPEF